MIVERCDPYIVLVNYTWCVDRIIAGVGSGETLPRAVALALLGVTNRLLSR